MIYRHLLTRANMAKQLYYTFEKQAFQCSKGVQQGDPLGPLLFSLVLLDFMNSIDVPSDISFQLWYLDDGTFAGTRPAVAELFHTHGPSFGLTLNLRKYEIFWTPLFRIFPLKYAVLSKPPTVWGSHFWKFRLL